MFVNPAYRIAPLFINGQIVNDITLVVRRILQPGIQFKLINGADS